MTNEADRLRQRLALLLIDIKTDRENQRKEPIDATRTAANREARHKRVEESHRLFNEALAFFSKAKAELVALTQQPFDDADDPSDQPPPDALG